MPEKFDIRNLNAAQREAVQTLHGPLLILAGAGTGKTRTVTCRIAHMVEKGIAPANILALTFTNKAAREMAERIGSLIEQQKADLITVSTFHSLCVRILRRDIGRLGYKENFSIFTGSDQVELIKRLIVNAGARREKLEPAQVIAAYSAVRNRNLTFRDIEDSLTAHVAATYSRELKAQNAVDFDDLLLLAERLLRDYPGVHDYWQKKFNYVTVDEFQDTNSLQMDLLRQLVGPHRNICVVGDDDQSIYGWRGARISNILEFEKYFPRPHIIKLEENYRCTRRILDCANALIRHNVGRREKTLRTEKTGEYPVRVISIGGAEQESEFIADEIENLHRQKKLPWEKFAVLFRANAQSRATEIALRKLHIPYRMVGTRSFFDRREVKDILSYLHTLSNPAADLHLLRILNTPARGISTVTAELAVSTARNHRKSLWDTLQMPEFLNECSCRTQENVRDFIELIRHYRAVFTAPGCAYADCLKELLDKIGYCDYVTHHCKTETERMSRLAAVGDMLTALREAKPEGNKLSDLLAVICLDNEKQEEDIENKKGVCLITMHAAKGLEFPHVYIIGVEKGLLPHTRSVDEGNLDEERRLFYVGITRAQEALTLTYCTKRNRYGKEEKCAPSDFLAEIPETLYEFIDYNAVMREPVGVNASLSFLDSLRAGLDE